MRDIPFEVVEWTSVPPTEHKGTSGVAVWRTRQYGAIRVRRVEYSPGYVADHWCDKGHLVFCAAGELRTVLKDGRTLTLTAGMSYHVGDGVMAHRSQTATGATLLIVD